MSEMNFEKHKRGKYSDPSPYPEVKVLNPNLNYAEILMDDYAGIVSEFTAISQYLYHHILFKQINKELGELLENVAITKMLHMEILAETIKKLVGDHERPSQYSFKRAFKGMDHLFQPLFFLMETPFTSS